uniref:Peroxisomal ATPase PEX1 N-terminal C-lobe domain-containing protein n=1 Tax=Plectus sambesii TaxID=2011161 RepID=A0A914UTC4_9BILA
MSLKTFPALLVYHNWKNCFAYTARNCDVLALANAPSNVTSRGVAQLCHDGSSVRTPMFVELFATRGAESDRSGSLVVAVNGMAAMNAGFENEQQIIVQLLPNLPTCTRVEVEPLSSDDWEIIQHSTGRIEESFSDQIRVVQTGMVFPIWVERNMRVMFRISSFNAHQSEEAAVVSQSAEVIVAPPPSGAPAPARAPVSTLPHGWSTPKDAKETGSSSLLQSLMANFSINQADDPAD